MNVLVAVIDDLYSFAFGVISRLFTGDAKARSSSSVKSNIIEMPGKTEYELLPSFHSTYYEGVSPQKNSVMYIQSIDTPLRTEPSLLRDVVIDTISYGKMVMVLEIKNGWSKIHSGKHEGWIETKDLADRAAHVLPQFVVGEGNDADDPNTIRLRAMIKDEFSCGAAGLPLQAHEYIVFRLLRKDITIVWPSIRPRVPGSWSKILNDSPYVTTSSTPHVGSVCEFSFESGGAHMMYVEAVFPDDTIQVTEVNWPERGIYNDRIMTEGEWKALKPVFIQFT